MTLTRALTAALAALLLSHPAPATANGKSPNGTAPNGTSRVPPIAVERTGEGEPVIVHQGEASFYGGRFHGRKTASGETFDQNRPTAASPTLPLGTKATVTHQGNGRNVDVIINDRGPYVGGRIIDLSTMAARRLDMIDDGTAPVRVEARPSDQPTEQAKEKVETKAEQADRAVTAGKPGGASAGASSDRPAGSGSGR